MPVSDKYQVVEQLFINNPSLTEHWLSEQPHTIILRVALVCLGHNLGDFRKLMKRNGIKNWDHAEEVFQSRNTVSSLVGDTMHFLDKTRIIRAYVDIFCALNNKGVNL